MHIAVAGNIGSGKTTLTQMLAEHYGWRPQYEAVSYNPYLEDYYKNIDRWSFAMEVFFLKERFKNILEIARSPDKYSKAAATELTEVTLRSFVFRCHIFPADKQP